MSAVVTALAAVLFFLALMACVALHEVGHMVPAKLFGVRVPKYFVGFGRTLWSRRRGDTEYGVKLFPLGGFVQLLGMYPPRRPDARDSRLQRLADEAREVEWEEISDADRAAGRLFYQQATWKKLVMMTGGITMNLIIAFVLFWGVAGLYGNVRQSTTVASVTQCLITEQRDDRSCRPSDPRTPAASAGLQAGDRVLEFNGQPIARYDDLTRLIRANMAGEARLVVERAGVRTALTPVHTIVMPVRDQLDPAKIVQAGWLGVSPTSQLVKGGPVEVLDDMKTMSAQSLVALAQLPVKTFNVVVGMVRGEERDATSPISVVGASVAAGQVATHDQVPLPARAAWFVSLLASVNLFLALFNLVPLPPLDGGHIVGALYEALRRGVARLLGRPDPGPADTAKMLPVAYVVGGLLLLCGIALIAADIMSPVKIF